MTDYKSQASIAMPTLREYDKLMVRQRRDMLELIGFETRNKYSIQNIHGQDVAYAAEQGKGFLASILRVYLGHWRSFEIHFFTPSKQTYMIARHPFRFYFQELNVADIQGRTLGTIKQRFAIFSKRFTIFDAHEKVVFEVKSPFWKLWTFMFTRDGRELASIKKKWSGFLREAFTDKDTFLIEFADPMLKNDERQLLLAASVFVDLQYFEKKAD